MTGGLQGVVDAQQRSQDFRGQLEVWRFVDPILLGLVGPLAQRLPEQAAAALRLQPGP